jgi:hypothetical protein
VALRHRSILLVSHVLQRQSVVGKVLTQSIGGGVKYALGETQMKKILVILVLALTAYGVAKSKRAHTMDDYNLVGVLYWDAADTSGMYHSGDGEYVCTEGDATHGPNCRKDEAFVKFRLSDGRGGIFTFIPDEHLITRGAGCNENPLECVPEFYQCNKSLSSCDVRIKYREENGHIFIPFNALVKKQWTLREAEYRIDITGDLRDVR